METLIKATLAGLSTIIIHLCFAIVGTLIAKGKEIHGLSQPLSWQTIPNYLVAFVIQAVAFVFVYFIIGKRLPGNSILTRGVFFGLIIYLLAGISAIAPMIFVFKQGVVFYRSDSGGRCWSINTSCSYGDCFRGNMGKCLEKMIIEVGLRRLTRALRLTTFAQMLRTSPSPER